MKRLYLAYGSNLNLDQMKFRCPDAKIIGTGKISDYELLFKGSLTGSYLTIEKKPGAYVPVAIWETSEADERTLDVYEGCPRFYYKKLLTIPCRDKSGKVHNRTAYVYIMHEDRKIGVPRNEYVEACMEGYKAFGFDEELLWTAYTNALKLAK